MLRLGWLYLASPRLGAQASRQDCNFTPSLLLYAIFLIGFLLYSWLRPADFPDAVLMPEQASGLAFWLKTTAWQPLLELAFTFFLVALGAWLQEGKLALKLGGGILLTAIPFVSAVIKKEYPSFPGLVFAAIFVAWAVLFCALAGRAKKELWRPSVAYMLGINVIGLALLLPTAAASFIRSNTLYYGAQIVGGFWILAWGTLGFREIATLRLPRAFMAVLLATFLQAALALNLRELGLMSPAILKALLYA